MTHRMAHLAPCMVHFVDQVAELEHSDYHLLTYNANQCVHDSPYGTLCTLHGPLC